MPTDIVLRVPARTGSIHLLRTVATSAGAWSDMSVDDIDDVALAVTEAASHLLSNHLSASTLRLQLSAIDRGIRVRVQRRWRPRGAQDGRRNAHADEATVGSFAWQILLALSEDLHTIDGDGEVGVIFSKSPRVRDVR